MTFTPALNGVIVALVFLPLLAFAVWRLVRARSAGGRLDWALRVVMVIAALGLVLRPGIPGGQTQTLTTSVDVVFVVDTTSSMAAEDWRGGEQRLAGVKEDIASLLDDFAGARFALVSFDSAPQLRVPFTSDASAVDSAVGALSTEITLYSQGSDIGNAAPLLVDMLSRAAEAAPERSRVLFYLGDGEQTASSSPTSLEGVARWLNGGSVLGYGTEEGGRMLERQSYVLDDEGGALYIQDPSTGEDALSRIDIPALESIASQLGVGFQHRVAGTEVQVPSVTASTVPVADGGSTGSVLELYWIFAAVLLVLVLRELVLLALAATRMREASGGGRP